MHENSAFQRTVTHAAGATTTVETRVAGDVIPSDVVAYHVDYANLSNDAGSANDVTFESHDPSAGVADDTLIVGLAANDSALFGHTETESVLRVPAGNELRVTTDDAATLTLGIRPENL
jgi:hypothetical protein